MFSKLKQVRDLQSKAKSIQSALANERVEGSGAWGKVKIGVDGNQSIQSVSIDDSMMSDKAKLEAAIKEATNDAMEKVRKVMASKLKDLGGLDLAKDMQDMLGK